MKVCLNRNEQKTINSCVGDWDAEGETNKKQLIATWNE